MNETMLSFFREFLGIIADFLVAEPIIYFTAIFIGIFVLAIIKKLLHLR